MSSREQKTILLVQGGATPSMAEAETIKQFGYQVITANTGEKAIESAISNATISLILMDIDLNGGIDGPEAARQILEKRNIPIVFLTSHSEKEYVDKVKEIAHYGYVIKNSGDCVLQSSIEMALELFETHEKTKVSEIKYRRLHESIMDAFVVVDTAGNILEANQSYMDMLGYSMEELLQLTYFDMTPEKWRSFESKIINEQVMVRGFSDVYEKEYIRKNGIVFPVELRAVLINDDKGQPLGLWGIVRDITSRKQAEEAITKEREKLKTLSENAPFGMVLIDKDNHFTYINRKFTELFGYHLSDIPDGRTWCRKAYPDAGYRHAVVSAWKKDLGDAKPGERKNIFTVTCRDGTQKIIQFIFSVLVSGDSLMTCEDITALRQLENQLRQAQKTEAIGTLAGGIAHDFNNILTALMGYAALIQIKMDMTDPLRAYVDEVFTASRKAVDLTQSLLAFSRQQPVTLVPLDINNTVKVAEKLLRRLLTEDIEFSTSLTNDNTIVMADKSQMDQILFNLVTNARDAMPKGGVLTITTAIAVIDNTFIKIHGFGEPGEYVQISISDTGMGMNEITQQKIFDPFFTTKEIGKGTGLGLATVYGIVKQHNGYITVVSTLNQGTNFHVYLPHLRGKVDETEDTIIPIKRGKETILIAEDNEGVRRFMREALQQYGYIIREATNGEDAIERFKEYRDIDIIIIDSVMPKKNGRETYEEIHGMDPHIKVLFISGYTKDVVLDKGIEEKEFDFIAKPLSLNKLLQKVREVLDR